MKKLRYEQYSAELLESKCQALSQMPERARRLFIAQEYLSLGYGSQRYISEVFGLNRESIIKGVKELRSEKRLEVGRQRRRGGGRKKKSM
jgi:hypothetical protein